jgi:predicted nucleic acid-binding protein
VNFLLDTNVLCEPARLKPDPGVLGWLAEADEDRLHISAVTLAEVQRGVSRLPSGTRRDRIQRWLEGDVLERFGDRILPLDNAVAIKWGQIMAREESAGRTMNSIDGFIAATAVVGAFTLVTRNVSDFRNSVPKIENPWLRS